MNPERLDKSLSNCWFYQGARTPCSDKGVFLLCNWFQSQVSGIYWAKPPLWGTTRFINPAPVSPGDTHQSRFSMWRDILCSIAWNSKRGCAAFLAAGVEAPDHNLLHFLCGVCCDPYESGFFCYELLYALQSGKAWMTISYLYICPLTTAFFGNGANLEKSFSCWILILLEGGRNPQVRLKQWGWVHCSPVLSLLWQRALEPFLITNSPSTQFTYNQSSDLLESWMISF